MRSLKWLQQCLGPWPIRSDERGASLALVALSLGWILGMAALVLDIGSGWLTRQTLIPATDAAALAAAQDLVDRPWAPEDACETAEFYVTANAPGASMTSCEISPFGSDGGRVTIVASEEIDGIVADPADDDLSIQSVSTATWGPPSSVSELRPVGFCYDGSFDLRQLIDDPPTSSTWVRVHFLKDDPTACGGLSSAGNFATIDFGSGTEIDEIRYWMEDGYPGLIGFDDPPISSCDDLEATCYHRPYASSDLIEEFTSLQNSYVPAVFPVFDFITATEVHLIGAIRARLYDFEIYGDADDWYFDLKVEPGLITGTCCGSPGLLADNMVIAICGVDPGQYPTCYSGATS